MKKLSIIFIIIFCSSITFIFSETAEERLLRKREQRILNYVYQAKAGGRNQKIFVLDTILEEFESQSYSLKDKKLVNLIIELSEEGTVKQEFENNQLINNFPEVRRKSCIALAKLGGDEARGALLNILANDTNSNVKAEACNSLAIVGDNESGEVLRAIVYMFRTTYKPDSNLIFAIINTVKTIAIDNASAYSDALLILSEIQMGNYNSFIREEAYKAIQSLNADDEG